MESLHDILDVAGEAWFYFACGTILFGIPMIAATVVMLALF